MKVDAIMTRKVRTCHPGDTLNTPASVMWEADCGCVPVVEDERLVGMITDRDICMSAYVKGRPLGEIKVHDAMAKQVSACRPDDDILDAEKIMREHQVRRLPVASRDGRLVGVLSLADIIVHRGREVSPAELVTTLDAICQPRAAAMAEAAE